MAEQGEDKDRPRPPCGRKRNLANCLRKKSQGAEGSRAPETARPSLLALKRAHFLWWGSLPHMSLAERHRLQSL